MAKLCEWLLPIGEYYTILMDNPVAYDAPDGGAVFYYERRKNRVRDEMTCYGTYRAEFLTII